jgi:hypothetical protein
MTTVSCTIILKPVGANARRYCFNFICYQKNHPSRDTIPLNACLHAPDGDGSAEDGECGEQDGGDGECAPQRELAALQRFRAHMVQAVHGHHGLGNAREKKVTNVVVIRNASAPQRELAALQRFWAHMVQAVHGHHGLGNAGEKKVTNIVVVLFRAHFGSGCTVYTDTTAWEMREKRRLQMSSLFCSGRT